MKIYHKKEIYTRTASGKNWKKNPDTVTEEECTHTFYINFVGSCKFFNNWGNGAYCRKYYGYTKAGYLPNKVITVSPGRTTKHVDTFNFISE